MDASTFSGSHNAPGISVSLFLNFFFDALGYRVYRVLFFDWLAFHWRTFRGGVVEPPCDRRVSIGRKRKTFLFRLIESLSSRFGCHGDRAVTSSAWPEPLGSNFVSIFLSLGFDPFWDPWDPSSVFCFEIGFSFFRVDVGRAACLNASLDWLIDLIWSPSTEFYRVEPSLISPPQWFRYQPSVSIELHRRCHRFPFDSETVVRHLFVFFYPFRLVFGRLSAIYRPGHECKLREKNR